VTGVKTCALPICDIVVPVDALGDADIRRLFSLFQNEDGMLRSRDFCAWLIG
jgi:hypothetical protein